jgi:preprotein translocase subunit YajC
MNLGSGGAIIIWILVFFGIFYFLAIRPQRRQKQAHAQMERMLKKGDEVVTIGGQFGTVSRIGDDWVELEVAKRTKVRFMKRAISSITDIAEDVEDEDEEEYIEVEDEDVEEVDESDDEVDEMVYDEDDVEEDDDQDVDEEDEEAPEGPAAPEAPKL